MRAIVGIVVVMVMMAMVRKRGGTGVDGGYGTIINAVLAVL